MPLEREVFTVYLAALDDGPEREVTATISHQDMMRAELTLKAHGVDSDAKLNLVTCWTWAALSRQGDYTGPWDRYRDVDCQGLTDAGTVTVDPTQPGTPGTQP